MKRLISLCMVVFLVACTTMEQKPKPVQDIAVLGSLEKSGSSPAEVYAPAPVPAPASPPPVMASAPVPVPNDGVTRSVNKDSFSILAKDYLFRDMKLEGYRYNAILLPNKPITTNDKIQYENICQIWKESFPDKAEYSMLQSSFNIVPFYWLLKTQPKATDCSTLIENYDYARAQALLIKHKLDPSKVYIINDTSNGVVVFNLSKITKLEDIELAMDTWREKMCSVPKDGTKVHAYDLLASAKTVLGALGSLLELK